MITCIYYYLNRNIAFQTTLRKQVVIKVKFTDNNFPENPYDWNRVFVTCKNFLLLIGDF